MKAEATASQIKQYRDTQANNAIASDMAKEIRGSTTAGTDRAFSNRES